jgi:hypothetical protein
MHDNSTPGRRRLPAAGRGLAALAAGLACTAGLAAGSPAHAATGRGPLALPPGSTRLNAVSADSATDAWAVGTADTGPAGVGVSQSLALHWKGTSWAKVKSPNPGGTTSNSYLEGVAAVSPTDAWAVGYYLPAAGASSTPLILHWNGTSWARATAPNPGNATLASVSVVSATSIWATGSYTPSGGQQQTLMLHWNGTKWSRATTPNPGVAPYGDYLQQVKAISATDAWAGGAYYASNGHFQTLMLHWNGKAWTQVSSPNPGPANASDYVTGIGATSATNAWAIGQYSSIDGPGPFSMHLKGSAWTQVSTPAPSGSTGTVLNGLSPLTATSAWAVGSSDTTSASLSLVLRWNGKVWAQATSPNPGGTTGEDVNSLNAVSGRTSSDAWAVGYYGNPTTPDETLILHWNGTSWTQAKSPN